MARIPVILPQAPIGSSNPGAANGLNKGPTALPMQGPAMPREQFPIRAMNRTQSAARQATRQSTSSDDADCSVIRGVSLTAGVTSQLAHGLTDSKGRPRAWVGARIESPQVNFARFIVAHVNPAQDAATIAVTADANCVCDVRVW